MTIPSAPPAPKSSSPLTEILTTDRVGSTSLMLAKLPTGYRATIYHFTLKAWIRVVAPTPEAALAELKRKIEEAE